jgi:hypothetical protein
MGTDPEFAPKDIDLDRPNAARVYDWLLGGTANWAIDREFGDAAVRAVPIGKTIARVNRDFLGRAVRYAVRNGVTQFLDLGSGVPTVNNVHEVADSLAPDSRCVYVDNEPVAVAHSEILLDEFGDPNRHAVIRADLRDTAAVWRRAWETGVLDPDEPICLLMVAVLHFVTSQEEAQAATGRYRELLPHGSYLAMSHASNEGVSPPERAQIEAVLEQYQRSSTPFCFRTRSEFAALFGDFDLVEPGVCWLPEWRLEEAESEATAQLVGNPSAACVLGAMARKV